MWHDEARQLKAWYKKRPNADIAHFKANHLTYGDKLNIITAEIGIEDWRDYP